MGGGDFDVIASAKTNHGRNGIIDIDGEFTMGNIGEGMQSAGTGCNGCTGCNVKLEKSKIKEEMAKANTMQPSDPNYRRRYDTWDGVGCGGCGYLIYMGPPLYYNDWGYHDYNHYVIEQNIVIENDGGPDGGCGGCGANNSGGGCGGGGGDGDGGDGGGGCGGGGDGGGDAGGGCGGDGGGGGCGGGGCGGGCGGD